MNASATMAPTNVRHAMVRIASIALAMIAFPFQLLARAL
jgi:hypothetical protein